MDEQQNGAESERRDIGGKKGGDHRYGKDSDQRHGKDSRKGGKADRQKGGGREVGGETRGKAKDGQSWVQKKGTNNKQRGGGAGEGTADQVLNGGALLSLLKANPPSVTRYSREELLSIGQLPASKVKPASLNSIVDKENLSSPLLVRPKVDKADRPPRNREGEKEEYHEEANGTQRHWQQRGDEEDDQERRRGRNRWSEEREQGRGQRWKDGHYEDDRALGGYHHHQEQDYHHYREDEWKMPSAPSGGKAEEWDMPDANDTGDLMDFTLGDIRKAEKAINKGMAMSDYKASLRAGNMPAPAELASSEERQDRDGSLGGAGFFVEEDEDISRTSRGFGKWFGRTQDNSLEGEDDADDLWDMPATAPSGGLAAPTSMGMSQGLGSVLPTAIESKASPASPSQEPEQRPPELHLPRSPEAHPMASSIERLLEESPTARREVDSPKDEMGKSILSMLGRSEPANGEASMVEDPSKQGKLTVSELFHLAQGKELPPIPRDLVNSRSQDEASAGDESDQQKMQRQAYNMAQVAMWMNAAKAGQPQMPPGNRYPGYQPTAQYGSIPPPAFGLSRQGGSNSVGGRGTAQDLYQAQAEAYAQMMGAGRGAFPMNSTARGGKGAQASWTSPMGAGYPYPRGQNYSAQSPYGAYAPHDYSHLSSGVGGYDGGNAQAYGSQAAAMHLHSMYSGGLGATPEGQAAVAGRSVAKSANEKGNIRNSHLTQASSLSAPLAGVTSGTGVLDGTGSPKLGARDAIEEESGCSQS